MTVGEDNAKRMFELLERLAEAVEKQTVATEDLDSEIRFLRADLLELQKPLRDALKKISGMSMLSSLFKNGR